VQIGDRVKSKINGFAGIITGTTEYLNGCRQHLVAPEALDKDGKVMDGIWTDEQNLGVVEGQVFPNPFAKTAKATAGGPDSTSRRVR